jgi:hypothetical protein
MGVEIFLSTEKFTTKKIPPRSGIFKVIAEIYLFTLLILHPMALVSLFLISLPEAENLMAILR